MTAQIAAQIPIQATPRETFGQTLGQTFGADIWADIWALPAGQKSWFVDPGKGPSWTPLRGVPHACRCEVQCKSKLKQGHAMMPANLSAGLPVFASCGEWCRQSVKCVRWACSCVRMLCLLGGDVEVGSLAVLEKTNVHVARKMWKSSDGSKGG